MPAYPDAARRAVTLAAACLALTSCGGEGPTIQPDNPVPTIVGISPDIVLLGVTTATVNVTGRDFVPGSVARWNGAARVTRVASSTSLQVDLTPADLAAAGSGTITVVNPAPGGGTSEPQTFVIVDPIPKITAVSPAVLYVGTAATLEITGSGFRPDSRVRLGDYYGYTTFLTPTTLRSNVPGYTHSGGTEPLLVENPEPLGGSSQPFPMPIHALVPVASWLSPVYIDLELRLQVRGSNFTMHSVILWNGTPRTTLYGASTVLQTNVPASELSPGTVEISVYTPAPGGGTSQKLLLTIDQPQPVIR